MLIELLKKTEAHLQVHDPIVTQLAIPHIVYCHSVSEALQAADVLVIMTPWPEYGTLTTQDLSQMRGRIIIDPYRVLQHNYFLQAGFQLYTLGTCLNTFQKISEASHV